MLPPKLFLPASTPLDVTAFAQPVRVVRGEAAQDTPDGYVAYLREDHAAGLQETALEHQAKLHAAEKQSWELAAASKAEHDKREADLLGYARGVQDARQDKSGPVVRGKPVITG